MISRLPSFWFLPTLQVIKSVFQEINCKFTYIFLIFGQLKSEVALHQNCVCEEKVEIVISVLHYTYLEVTPLFPH